jgi:hypothetical protein
MTWKSKLILGVLTALAMMVLTYALPRGGAMRDAALVQFPVTVGVWAIFVLLFVKLKQGEAETERLGRLVDFPVGEVPARNSQAQHLRLQRGALQAEPTSRPGGTGDGSASLPQHADDVVAFRAFQ